MTQGVGLDPPLRTTRFRLVPSTALSLLALHAGLLVAAGLMMVPLVWMTWMSSTTIAGDLTAGNFTDLFSRHPVGRWLVNSLFVSCAQTVLLTITSTLGGFALAKYQFRGRRVVMGLMLTTLFLPFQVLLPGAYQLMLTLGWVDTFAAVILPLSVSSFGTFLFAQAMAKVPDELIHAARIDGCSEWLIWWEVALPIVRPTVGAYVLLAFVGSWNGYLWPATVLLDESNYTLSIGLANLAGLPEYEARTGVLMAGAMVGLLPLILLFFWMQKELVGGLAAGAVKG